MNRQIRRDIAKLEQKLGIRLLTEQEAKEHCTTSYRIGLEVGLKAAKETLGLGEVRMQRILDKLAEIELDELNNMVERALGGEK